MGREKGSRSKDSASKVWRRPLNGLPRRRRRLLTTARECQACGGRCEGGGGGLRRRHAPRGASLDAEWMVGRPPRDEYEASEGGGAEGPCVPPPHASPPPAQRRAAGSSDRRPRREGGGGAGQRRRRGAARSQWRLESSRSGSPGKVSFLALFVSQPNTIR